MSQVLRSTKQTPRIGARIWENSANVSLPYSSTKQQRSVVKKEGSKRQNWQKTSHFENTCAVTNSSKRYHSRHNRVVHYLGDATTAQETWKLLVLGRRSLGGDFFCDCRLLRRVFRLAKRFVSPLALFMGPRTLPQDDEIIRNISSFCNKYPRKNPTYLCGEVQRQTRT
jgi:hypothetical protein